MHGYKVEADPYRFPARNAAGLARRSATSPLPTRSLYADDFESAKARLNAWRFRVTARKWRDARANVLALGIIATLAGAAVFSMTALVGALCVVLWQIL